MAWAPSGAGQRARAARGRAGAGGDGRGGAGAGSHARRLRMDCARRATWYRWGPYVSERQWGTVRERTQPDGQAWDLFPPRPRAVARSLRWARTPWAGCCDIEQRLCLGDWRCGTWPGPDPEGTAIRPDRPAGQPRRGRQGILGLLFTPPRLTHGTAGVTTIPQCAYPLPGPSSSRIAARGRLQHRIRADGQPGLFDSAVTGSPRCIYAKAGPDDLLMQSSVTERRPRAGHPARPADRLVSGTPASWDIPRAAAPRLAAAAGDRGHDRAPVPRRDGAHRGSRFPTAPPNPPGQHCCSARTRPHRAALRPAGDHPVPQGRKSATT